MHSRPILPLLFAAVLAGAAVPAQAEGAAKPKNSLPGVERGHAIVSPAQPRPEEAAAASEKSGGRGTTFKMGDFEVTVTGSISVEVGFGQRPAGERR